MTRFLFWFGVILATLGLSMLADGINSARPLLAWFGLGTSFAGLCAAIIAAYSHEHDTDWDRVGAHLRKQADKRTACYTAHHDEFEKVFGLSLATYWDERAGFDWVAFFSAHIAVLKDVPSVYREDAGAVLAWKWGPRARTLLIEILMLRS